MIDINPNIYSKPMQYLVFLTIEVTPWKLQQVYISAVRHGFWNISNLLSICL